MTQTGAVRSFLAVGITIAAVAGVADEIAGRLRTSVSVSPGFKCAVGAPSIPH